MELPFRLFDFNVFNDKSVAEEDSEECSSDGSVTTTIKDKSVFQVQMFGVNESGETCSIIVDDFKPFFYVKVDDSWGIAEKNTFLSNIKTKMGKFYENSITECKIIKRKKLYGFDGGKEHKFIRLEFQNINAFNKAKNLWYTPYITNPDGRSERKLLKSGLVFQNTHTYLYEANIPPLLRFFHIKNMSPSGWITLPKKSTVIIDDLEKTTTCTYEFRIGYSNIIPNLEKETRVPYKICSFDIEANSSHGDFPVPIKSYKKLASNIMEYFNKLVIDMTPDLCKSILKNMIMSAFGYGSEKQVDLVYPKKIPKNIQEIETRFQRWVNAEAIEHTDQNLSASRIEAMFEAEYEKQDAEFQEDNDGSDDEDEEKPDLYKKIMGQQTKAKKRTIVEVLLDKKATKDVKLKELNDSLNQYFPALEGDKVTFIGSTFLRYGEPEPYLNHCIALNTCETPANSVIESYMTEREVLLAWKDLIQRENPDIVIGYNIFGFDYEFMFRRAEENNCVSDFLKLSRNVEEICATKDRDTGIYKIEESSVKLASGEYNLHFIKMNGRLQIDLLNVFRREENLSSYKLDSVAGHFIGDYIKKLELSTGETMITTTNMTGLQEGSYVHIEEIGHSVDYYDSGAKFQVLRVNKAEKNFVVSGIVTPDQSKKTRWCLAKDDVTPKDIFRMSNGTAKDRSIIAKYCIQDCNLVHHLMNKSDVLTGFVEMANICSVPINFLVMRGQGIKLTSYIAKKCREKRTLMPVIEKGNMNEYYEGAIVLDPKCDLYLDNPIACVDYASLYPSSMISENLSHDSKVWTQEFDLHGNLVKECGEKDKSGAFIYDNLPGHEYVSIEYDTFKYVRKNNNPKAALEKIKTGKKVCRFAQGKAIMPSILEELLVARKTTRKLIPLQNDEFMKNVLDKRQLGYKVTANSLYGQCGAKTSTFYEKDIAACTTATGRNLLTYAKRVVEEVYGDAICETKNYGPVLTKAEYVYGDSVANYTPVYVRVNGQLDICTIESLAEKYGENNWVKCLEEGKQEKEFCELSGVETWTEKGWTKLYRVIRHELASHKKMVRVLTHTGLVDVTDDHSLLTMDGTEISPKDVQIGSKLLHHPLPFDKQYHLFPGELNTDFNMKTNKDHLHIAKCFAHSQSRGLTSYFGKDQILNFCYKHDSLLDFDKNVIIDMQYIRYTGYVYDLTTDNHHFAAGIGNMIVHNTDSVFFTFNLQTPEGQPIRGKKALEITIELAQEAGHLASNFLKKPHDLEYEKTFMPFCLLSKKRYVGMLYEHDPDKCKRKEMGIVLKRRDNAPIVKDVYGGIIDILMKEQNIQQATQFLESCLQNIVDENYPMDKLIITKSLRTGYKNPQSIAHKVLADRMTERDPGNKPSSGDRIPFVYIHNPNKKALQGEKIETPQYIKEANLKIDYSFYITNQIMKPVQQLFALVLEKIWMNQKKVGKIKTFQREINVLRKEEDDPIKLEKKIEKLRNKEIKILLFDEYLRKTNNEKNGNAAITSFFKRK